MYVEFEDNDGVVGYLTDQNGVYEAIYNGSNETLSTILVDVTEIERNIYGSSASLSPDPIEGSREATPHEKVRHALRVLMTTPDCDVTTINKS